jgi:5-methylcytosine-specific restriction protein A
VVAGRSLAQMSPVWFIRPMAKNIPEDITRDDVLSAIADFDSGMVQHHFHDSEKYDLLHDGKRYPPKAILGISARRSAGRVLEPSEFSGGESSACFRVLRKCGFKIELKPSLHAAPKTLLYAWNPSRWDWEGFEDAVATVREGKPHKMYWSCGNTKNIAKGDRFLLVRLGVEPKGIVGCGVVVSSPYPLPHWDKEKRAEGKEALRTDLEFTSLSPNPIITLHELEQLYPDVSWTPQSSGISVGEDIASELLAIFEGEAIGSASDSTKFEQTVRRLRSAKMVAKPDGQKAPKKVTRSAEQYERDPKVKAWVLQNAKGKCELCESDAPFMDDAGFPFLEVHHVVPLADGGDDVVSNAVALCPNCHRECHHGVNRKGATVKLKKAVAARGA